MMKPTVAIILLLTQTVLPVKAQYASINIDYKTMEAMTEAYATEAAIEALHNESLQKIYDSYQAAGVASSGIFASKYLDRKALTNLNLWDDEKENYYYTRIYNIVTKRIIPKTVTCARLMMEDPSTAIYWGSYLLKTTDDVKSLCQQFESIVTNSSLSFKDVAFLELTGELKAIFNITQLGGIDWKNLFEHLGSDIEGRFTKENLKADLETLINKGVGLANAGYRNGLDQLLQGTSFGGTFLDKATSVITLVDNASSIYGDFKNLSTTQFIGKLADMNSVGDMFKLSDYNITGWLTDYSEAAVGRQYTQRVYIYRRDQGSETVCDYRPPTDDNAIIYGDHWYRINTKDANFTPSSAQYEAILSNSASHAGWSRKRVNELNNGSSKYYYNMYYSPSAYILSKRKSGQYAKAYAYYIRVSKSWDIKEEVYEEVFDSYSMEWNTFMAQMKARLAQYNANGDHQEINNTGELKDYIDSHPQEPNYTYYIGYDNRRYYTTTDAGKLAGSSSATFSITCHDGGTLGKGSTTYKCKECGKAVDAHTKQCAMRTTLSGSDDSGVETTELQARLVRLRQQAATLQAQLDQLNKENSELLRKMSASTGAAYEQYRATYESNEKRIKALQKELDGVDDDIKDTRQAITEAQEGEKEQTDDYNRIPQLMKAMKDAYHINWSDAGSWSGNTFVRQGTVGNVKGQVTFKATLSIARKPKYFLGIKVHRAIVQTDWSLTSSRSDTSVAETMSLDPNKSDEENARLVNRKISELRRAHPNCDVTVEYAKTKEVADDTTNDVHHLLWASDRLEIARGIEARLARIYTDLVMVEKFLHYRHSLLDWAKDLAPKLNADSNRKLSIAEQCHRRWMANGGSANYQREDEDAESSFP